MRYIVTVDAVFPTHSSSEYDLWEVQTLVEATGPGDALKRALSFSRRASTWKLLRYKNEPVFHGVRIHS